MTKIQTKIQSLANQPNQSYAPSKDPTAKFAGWEEDEHEKSKCSTSQIFTIRDLSSHLCSNNWHLEQLNDRTGCGTRDSSRSRCLAGLQLGHGRNCLRPDPSI